VNIIKAPSIYAIHIQTRADEVAILKTSGKHDRGPADNFKDVLIQRNICESVNILPYQELDRLWK